MCRGNSVTSAMRGLYNKIEEHISDMERQSDFRAEKKRSCLNNVFVITQIIEKKSERNLSTRLVFIAPEKAYEIVCP